MRTTARPDYHSRRLKNWAITRRGEHCVGGIPLAVHGAGAVSVIDSVTRGRPVRGGMPSYHRGWGLSGRQRRHRNSCFISVDGWLPCTSLIRRPRNLLGLACPVVRELPAVELNMSSSEGLKLQNPRARQQPVVMSRGSEGWTR